MNSSMFAPNCDQEKEDSWESSHGHLFLDAMESKTHELFAIQIAVFVVVLFAALVRRWSIFLRDLRRQGASSQAELERIHHRQKPQGPRGQVRI